MRCLERSHNVTLSRVGNSFSGLLHPELVCFVVGLAIEEVILVCGEPEFEATLLVIVSVCPPRKGYAHTTYLLPQFLEECLTLLFRIIKGVLLSEVITKPSKCRHPISVQLCTSLLVLILLFLCKLALSHRQAKVRCPLEHGHRRSILRRLLRNLDTSRASADNSNSLALCRDSTLRPERRMVYLALERVQALPFREVALGGKADGINEVLCVCGTAVLGFDVPLVCLQIELSADDS